MAIHAQKTTFRSSAQFPDFLVTGPLTAGEILCYSESEKAFVNKAASLISGGGGGGPLPSGAILGAVNIGSGDEWFKGINVTDELEFRTILAGQGISVVQGADEIEIINDIVSTSSISVPHSFTIEIDNDDTTVDEAVFEILTNSNPASVVFTPLSIPFGALDISVVLPSSFVTNTGDFAALGYEPGMCIKVDGTTEQDGIWKIASIDTTTNSNDTITITIPFPDMTDAGAQPATTIDGMFFEFAALDTLVMAGRDLEQDGFITGQTIDIIGSTSNDGSYILDTVVSDTLTITTTFPGSIGCDVGDITVEVPAATHSTGWYVNELGQMWSNGATINGDIDVLYDYNINIDQGSLFLDGVDIITLINDGSLSVPGNGLVTQTATGVFESRNIAAGTGLSVTNADGVAGNPTIEVDDFDITLTGAVTGTGTVTELSDVVISTTLGNNGVVAGSYNKVTVDSTGRVTNGTNQTIFGGDGITVINGDGVAGSPIIDANNFNFYFTGDVTGNTTVVGLTNTTVALTLDSITVPGTYNTVTVDDTGRVVSGALIPGGSYQPADPALDDLAGGLTSPGYVIWDGSSYIDRVLTGAANEISIGEAAATVGDTVIGIADDAILPGVGAVTIPRGFAGDRPAGPSEGMIRLLQDTTNVFEGYVDGSWQTFLMDSATGFLPLSGGTMTGDIDMDGSSLLNVDLVDGRNLDNDGAVLDAINTGTGIKVQLAPDTFVNRDIAAVAPLVVTDSDGVAGNPTVEFDMLTVIDLEIGQVVDENSDSVLMYDDSQGELRRVSPQRLNNRTAHRYFMVQF